MEGNTEVDLKALLNIIKKRIWLILVITLLMASISVVYYGFINSPTYESRVGILIGRQSTEKITNQDVAMYDILYKTYNNIAESNEVAQIAAAKLGNGTEVNDLLSRTNVSENTGTMILNISVKNKTAADAYKEAEAYGEAFVERAKELKLSGGDIEIIEKAQLPSSPSGSNIKRNAVKAAFLGLLISVLVSFLLEYIK